MVKSSSIRHRFDEFDIDSITNRRQFDHHFSLGIIEEDFNARIGGERGRVGWKEMDEEEEEGRKKKIKE